MTADDFVARRADLADVTLYHLHTMGPAPFVLIAEVNDRMPRTHGNTLVPAATKASILQDILGLTVAAFNHLLSIES